jgi:hypothetical protein
VGAIDRCTDPTVGRFLLSYELGGLNSAQVDLFERHLLACPSCSKEVVAFSGAASMMRRSGVLLLRAATARRPRTRRVPALRLLWRPAALCAVLLAVVALLRLGPFAPGDRPPAQRSITYALAVPSRDTLDPGLRRSGFGLSGPAAVRGVAVFRYEMLAGEAK